MQSTKRIATIAAAAIVAVGVGVVAPSVASAATTMTCQAFADEPEVTGPNTVTALGSGKAKPGTQLGLVVLGQNVKHMEIDVVLLQHDPLAGRVKAVASNHNRNDGRSQLGQALNNPAPVEIGQAARWRAGGVGPAQVRYITEVSVSCQGTNGQWAHDSDVSTSLTTYLH
jgi:hypothetical protein